LRDEWSLELPPELEGVAAQRESRITTKKFRGHIRFWEWDFGMLNHLQTQRQLLFDLTANYLEPLPGIFSRLAYIARLRRGSTGKYVHDHLATVYPPPQIDEVLTKCHEELFERLLEMPLSGQEKDLRKFLNSLPGTLEDNARKCGNDAEEWVPSAAPSYLKELFRSNLNALTEILLDNRSKAR
jgi:hypothetical protein